MDYNKLCKKLLFDLKKMGLTRKMIEKELGYHPSYLDQVISRGANKTIHANLSQYKAEKEKLNVLAATKNEMILTLRAAVRVLTNELVELKTLKNGKSKDEVLKEVELKIVQVTLELAGEKKSAPTLKKVV